MFALSVTICKQLAVKICLTFRMDQCDFLFVGNSNVCPVTICEILIVEMCTTLTLTFRMERSNINRSRKVTCDFLCVGNCNACPICHRLRDNHIWTSKCTRFESLTLKMKVKVVDNFDENWLVYVHCQHAYVCKKNSTSRSSHLFAVHNHTFCYRTYIHTTIRPVRITPFQLCCDIVNIVM